MKRVALLFAALALGTGSIAFAKPQDAKPVYEAIAAHKAEAVQRLQDWIKVPSIAAEGRGTNEGCELMMKLAREAGFQKVERVDTERTWPSWLQLRFRSPKGDQHWVVHFTQKEGRWVIKDWLSEDHRGTTRPAPPEAADTIRVNRGAPPRGSK